jgi:poly(A) polymerase
VFLPGETRPAKPVKDKKKKTVAKSVKRSFADTGLDVRKHDPGSSKLTRDIRAKGGTQDLLLTILLI